MGKATIRREKMVIPTYEVGENDKNPMFFEKRVYQGSSGRVYPNHIIEKIQDEKINKEYNVIVMENDYLYVVVMPELGGRIYTAYDKTNNYDFVYHNHVIKPALVGLLGPWISGGIEFNWPQHHRPSTFMPLSNLIKENSDGSVSAFIGEIENMFSLKGMTEIKLYPDKSYIEIKVQIYNRSDTTQTFLWWANPAVHVNDYTKTIMPPDVTAVMDHGKRAVSAFPIARGIYYKYDYSKGVDISRYKNLLVPTSFMAYKSNFDFIGGYDFEKKAGIYHVADHHISPGKKQWTWGSGDFGKAWDRNLTDGDGPYVELMTGCFADNQPDFSFIMPEEEKTFTQYFMPYKHVGNILQANRDFCLGLEDGKLRIYSTGNNLKVKVRILNGNCLIKETVQDFTPNTDFTIDNVDDSSEIIINYDDKELRYSKNMVEKISIPNPAKQIEKPENIRSIEELYLSGLHIEQYRHATRKAEDYYLEGLKRDATDYRLNTAYGLLLLKSGVFEKAKPYFEKAIATLTEKNPNPITSIPYFYLGVSEIYLNEYDKAYDHFYKCIWNNENKSAAFYYLAAIDYAGNRKEKALEHIENSIRYNERNIKTRNLRSRIYLELNKKEAIESLHETIKMDELDVISRFELSLLNEDKNYSYLKQLTTYEITNLASDYLISKNYGMAEKLLDTYFSIHHDCSSLFYYYQNYVRMMQNKLEDTCKLPDEVEEHKIDFPSRLLDIVILKFIIEKNEKDYLATYLLGNLYYDKREYSLAKYYWELSESSNPKYPTTKRNLSLYYYNKEKDQEKALEEMKEAHVLDLTDSRITMELYELYKIIGKSPQFLFDYLKENFEGVKQRDDLYIEYINFVNELEDSRNAEKLILERNFHPWEGGEGKVTKVYKKIKIKRYNELKESNIVLAIQKLMESLSYPRNLGEGKLCLDYDNDIHFLLGEAYESIGKIKESNLQYDLATKGDRTIHDSIYYNDTPVEYKYYAAKALIKLKKKEEAKAIINSFVDYASKNMNKKAEIDYFAVSLPDTLIFEQDIDQKQRQFCESLLNYAKDLETLL